MMKGLKKWRLMTLFVLCAALLSACGEEYLSTLRPAGEVGKHQLDILLFATAIMTLVVVVVSAIYLTAFVKFRRKKVGEDHMPKQVEGSHTLEVIWTVIPIILLIILAVPTLIATYKFADVAAMDIVDEDGNKQALTVNVSSKLYWWEFEYPELGIVTAQELVVPTDENVYFNLISTDVKHSFWIPSVGGKLDTNVENINKFYLEFGKESAALNDGEGVFYGKCAELCGPSHALMDFKVKTLTRDAFDVWVASMQATEGVTASPDSADAGEAKFAASCIGCHAVSGVGTASVNPLSGPNLATFGDRNRVAGYMPHTVEDTAAWIVKPSQYKEGNTMPDNLVTEEEAKAIAEYLMTLKVEK